MTNAAAGPAAKRLILMVPPPRIERGTSRSTINFPRKTTPDMSGRMLTDLSIKKLALPDKRREVPDGKIGGLYLIVQPSGAKSWAVRYRADGLPRKLTLGPYPAVDSPTRRTLQPEATGAVMEVTKWLKPSV